MHSLPPLPPRSLLITPLHVVKGELLTYYNSIKTQMKMQSRYYIISLKGKFVVKLGLVLMGH